MTRINQELELYIHIPFCVQKCKYCDFLSAPANRQVQSAYMEALLREVKASANRLCVGETVFEKIAQQNKICSIFIGGGTPSVVEPEWIERLMDVVRETFEVCSDAEVSMEVNPGTVSKEALMRYRKAGINRLSIGCQSTQDAELARIGRIHSHAQFLEAYQWACEAGFAHINVDLMSALPGQSMEHWERNLRSILQLAPVPEHISAYSLIVEENTPFYTAWEEGQLDLPTEELEREMYWKTAQILQEKGYEHYEISNYAKPGCACKHNVGYWTRKAYLGYGIGAASLYKGMRFANTRSLDEYLQNSGAVKQQIEKLTRADEMAEMMFLGLRMQAGVSKKLFRETFGVTVDSVYDKVLAESEKEGLLQIEEDRIFLTEKGVDVSNYVMAKFL